MSTILTPEELRDFLATLLAGAAGGSHASWMEAIGPVEKLPTHLYLSCNWRVSPTGKRSEIAAIQKAIELVREEHPYVVPKP